MSLEEYNDPAGVCNADLKFLGNGKQDAYLGLDYDNLDFADLDANPIDGRTCNIIYEDDGPRVPTHVRSEYDRVRDKIGNRIEHCDIGAVCVHPLTALNMAMKLFFLYIV